jgi:hypothetical protein
MAQVTTTIGLFATCERCGKELEFTEDGYCIQHATNHECSIACGYPYPYMPDSVRTDPDAAPVTEETQVAPAPEPAPVQTPAAPTGIPPQLANVLGDAAGNVAGFAELAPGIPASDQILDDLFRDAQDISTCLYVESVDCFEGTRVEVRIEPEHKKKILTGFCADIAYYSGGTRGVTYYPRTPANTMVFHMRSEFPPTKAGIKQAFDYIKEEVNRINIRGFCAECRNGERQRKRLRVRGAGVCASCVLRKVVF